jgi:V/A-type H+/Na+-transporting ATPase subunit C
MLKYINENTNTQEEYGYACARIRELERSLLTHEILEKMLETQDLESTLKVLSESSVDEYVFEDTKATSIDNHLAVILSNTFKIIKDISPYPYLSELFNWKYDFHNLKVLLKSKLFTKQETISTYEIGNMKQDILRAAVFEGKYQSVPMLIERFIKQTEEEYAKSEDIQLIESLLDKGYYETIFKLLKEFNQPFLDYFYKIEIDLTNIMIACRCKIRKINKSKLSEVLIDCGNFSIQKFLGIYENSVHSWPNYFQKTDYFELVERGIKYWQEENSLLELERLIDNYILDLLEIGKYTSFGLESIVGYYYAKENDIKNIRMILNGKRYQLPKDNIQKILRNSYV